jgi:hypothetical protein
MNAIKAFSDKREINGILSSALNLEELLMKFLS